mmetsp:Transcript_43902/g.103367  ORF Transcript_43902/g.103367 Transcript_43902/m.103367 type:complete len:284 (+) Transcript_43902:413-1264(+)
MSPPSRISSPAPSSATVLLTCSSLTVSSSASSLAQRMLPCTSHSGSDCRCRSTASAIRGFPSLVTAALPSRRRKLGQFGDAQAMFGSHVSSLTLKSSVMSRPVSALYWLRRCGGIKTTSPVCVCSKCWRKSGAKKRSACLHTPAPYARSISPCSVASSTGSTVALVTLRSKEEFASPWLVIARRSERSGSSNSALGALPARTLRRAKMEESAALERPMYETGMSAGPWTSVIAQASEVLHTVLAEDVKTWLPSCRKKALSAASVGTMPSTSAGECFFSWSMYW